MNTKNQSQPLSGRRVVVTRSQAQAAGLTDKLAAQGADVIELPLIEVVAYKNPDTTEEVFDAIAHYEWILFTSTNGVKYFFEQFFERFQDIRSMGFMRIGAVGMATARAIESLHLKVEAMPQDATGEGLAKELIQQQTLDNLKILVVTGNRNRETLVKLLEEERAIVDTMPVYQTRMADLGHNPAAQSFRETGADAIVFASGSAAESFVKQARSLQLAEGAAHPLTCSIGPSTTEVMRKSGIPVDVEAREHSMDGIVDALIRRWS